MTIRLFDMKVTYISNKFHYEIEYQGNVYIVQRQLFHSIYDERNNTQSHSILMEMFKDDLFLKGYCNKPDFVNEEDTFWLGLINNDLKKQIPPPPKLPEPPKTRVIGKNRPGVYGIMGVKVNGTKEDYK